jgi:hypothetical protein
LTSYAGCRCLRARYFERVHDEFMSRGTKRPRSAPGGSGGERGQVWIFTPEDGRELPAQKDLRSQAMELADDRELVAKVRRTHLVSGAPRPWQRRPDCVGTPVADGVSLGRSAWSRRRTARHLSRGLEARSSWLIRERLSRCLRASRGTVRAPSMARVAGLLRLCGCSV